KDLPLFQTSEIEFWPQDVPLKNRRVRQDNVLVVVTVSGGGIRSAYWTFTVLKELELGFAKRGIDLPTRIRLGCGASGGMLGSSYYVATLPSPEKRRLLLQSNLTDTVRLKAYKAREKSLKKQLKLLSSDFLTPLSKRMIISDLPGWLSPWPLKYDRG